MDKLADKIKNNETLFLPMATIIETGNHIAQNGDGQQRRQCAERFVVQVRKAIEGTSPFQPINFLTSDELGKWLSEFPDSAMRGRGLGDLSIIHDFQRFCRKHPGYKVYIWSLDGHLSSFCRE